jgi:hypothetical protein
MNRQHAKSAKKTNDKSSVRFMRRARSVELLNEPPFFLGALGALAVKKVLP